MKKFRVLMFDSFNGEVFDFACEYLASDQYKAVSQATIEFPDSTIINIREV